MAQGKEILNTSATLIKHFETVDDLANANLDELTAFIAESSRGRFADLDAAVQAIQAAIRGSYRLSKTVNDTVNQAMFVFIAVMRALKKPVNVLDKPLNSKFEITPNILTSIPGIDKVYSAGIVAEIGDIHRSNSQASVAKFANLVWHKNSPMNLKLNTPK